MASADSRQCAFCGKPFTVPSNHPNTKCCSSKCGGDIRRTIPDKLCESCGKQFRPRRNCARWCSRLCAGITHVEHGLSQTRAYVIWCKMLARCYGETSDNYRWYGGIGTYVCKRWRESVQSFIGDMGQPPSRLHTLDRIETKGHYTCGHCDECREKEQPANCRWATKYIQVRNAKNNRWYTHDGKTLILKDWARLTGIRYLTLWNRLNTGMPFAAAISAGRYDRKAIAKAKCQAT